MALDCLQELDRELDLPEDHLKRLRQRYQRRVDRHGGLHYTEAGLNETLVRVGQGQALLDAQRLELERLRDQQGISPAVFRSMRRDLDVEQTRLDR